MKLSKLSIPVVLAAGLLVTSCSGTNQEQPPAPSQQDTTTQSPGTQSSDVQPEASAGRDIVTEPPTRSIEEALQAALKIFPGSASQIKLSADRSGVLLYRFELFSDSEEADIHLDAESLKEVKREIEPLEPDDRFAAIDLSSLLSVEDAAKLARAEQAGTITEWALEFDDSGIFEYEFELTEGGNDVDVVLNAETGTIIEIDR